MLQSYLSCDLCLPYFCEHVVGIAELYTTLIVEVGYQIDNSRGMMGIGFFMVICISVIQNSNFKK
jgi:uncharacterized membrane protein